MEKINIKKIAQFLQPSVSWKSARASLFLFISLLLLSGAFFVVASNEETSDKNIFLDADQDGLSNDEEKLYGTDPFKKDTDGDSYSDGVEIESGYDPLKPAPGDKIVTTSQVTSALSLEGQGGDNLTEKISQEIESVLANSEGGEEAVTLKEVDEAVQNILGEDTEVVMPEIDMEKIKIKESPSSSLPEAERKEQIRKDVMEYATVIAYIFANNSPVDFQGTGEAESMIGGLADDAAVAFSSGDLSFLSDIADQGKKILEETENIEVPEAMLESHVKALQFAKYATQLGGELQPREDDPLSQIAVLSKAQGLLGVANDFAIDITATLAELGITEIPLDL